MTGRAIDSHVPLNDVVAQAVSAHVSESYCPSQTIFFIVKGKRRP